MKTMNYRAAWLFMVVLGLAGIAVADQPRNPFVGHWALTLPNGQAGWLGIDDCEGKVTGNILWGGGSVVPVNAARVEGDTLKLTRITKDKKTKITETITATIDADILRLTTSKNRGDGKIYDQAKFTGKRIAPMPPAPDLSKVKFGEPIALFNGKNLEGWKLLEPKSTSGWSVKDGIMTNNPAQKQGKHINYGNLRTEKEFEDFNLQVEVNVPKGGNSGVYLRGIYEVQVLDSYGKKVDSHNMGAVYSRITPTAAAEKPAGEWQTMDITLVNRHVTVILNGKKIIDNQPIFGCTGGALWSDEFRPGPIYLQGDHSGVSYRKLLLRPVVGQ